jgi:hypothetical protein
MVYEGGHRIPLIIRYDDNFPQNEERSRIVGLNDLYATICELIGISVPYLSAQDSISFAEYIKDGSKHSGLRQDLAVWDYQGNKMRVSCAIIDPCADFCLPAINKAHKSPLHPFSCSINQCAWEI